MGTTLNEQIINAAAKAPRVFIDASLGEGDEYNREPGMQLTKEQIISLRKYEKLALRLPIRYHDVVAYLNYGASHTGSNGLTVNDFLRTFTMTYDHAKRWSPLRQQIMLTGTDLKIFAGAILRIGDEIVEVYTDLKSSRYLEEHNINTPEEYQRLKMKLPDLPGLELGPEDVPDIKYSLTKMLDWVKSCHVKAERVRTELGSFGTDMLRLVIPEIELRLKFVSQNTYDASVKSLQKVIDDRAALIDELNKRYDQLVQDAIKSAATFNVGGLILGIYQGVKAEEVRKERSELQGKQEADNVKMASKNQTLSSLNRVRDDLQNLSYVAIEAEVATQNLMLVWNALSSYISASMKEVGGVENATSLRRFINHIRGVVEPWRVIQKSADELVKVFAAADAEYDKHDLLIWKNKKMISGFSAPRYTPYNVVDLRNLNAKVQESSIHAQMLSEQYGYLPGVVATMKSLGAAISDATFGVRKRAQTTSIQLAVMAKKLKDLQDELANPDDVEEVREDMEDDLQQTFKTLATHADDLKGIKAGMCVSFDRAASARWVATLELDRASAKQLKANAQEKIVALESEMKSVTEAINVIGKAGIEKIGEEAQLTFESLQALGMAPPQVQVALLAVDTLKKWVAGIGDVISYLNMVDGYDRLRERAGVLKIQLETQARNITRLTGKIEMVKALDSLDDARWAYVNEYENIVNAFSQFTRDFHQDTSLPVEERVVVALARIKVIVTYLQPIQR